MVAYSFKAMFEPQVALGIKLQTVRADRRRHARPGEMLQLYVGMRTRQCRKIRPDVHCIAVTPIEICTSDLIDEGIVSIAIDGVYLEPALIEAFAMADGFYPNNLNGVGLKRIGKTARENMGAFWMANHGAGRFEGVLISWSLS